MALIGPDEAIAETDPDGISLNLLNRSNGLLIHKSIALTRTVQELLVSLILFPDPEPSVYDLEGYVVVLQRTSQNLQHSKTLESCGVKEADTLEIICPRAVGYSRIQP